MRIYVSRHNHHIKRCMANYHLMDNKFYRNNTLSKHYLGTIHLKFVKRLLQFQFLSYQKTSSKLLTLGLFAMVKYV